MLSPEWEGSTAEETLQETGCLLHLLTTLCHSTRLAPARLAVLHTSTSSALQVQGISAIISTPSSIQEVLLGVTPPGFINLVGPILGGNAQ